MGIFRFALAAMVALYHITRAMPIELGLSAVLCFYFLSGYYMAGLYQNFTKNSQHPQRSFYFDRCFRLLPAFWITFFLTLSVYLLDGSNSLRFNDPNTRMHAFLEFLIIPFSFTHFFFSNAANINPPTWSLGVEFIFYLFVPLLALLNGKQLKILLLFSFLLYTLSILFFGHLHVSDVFGGKENCVSTLSTIAGLEHSCKSSIANIIYRMPFFSCLYFIFGYCWAACLTQAEKRYSLLVLCLSFLGLFIYSVEKDFWSIYSVDEVLWTGIIFIPVTCLAVDYIKGGDPVDKFLGRLSYPLFLSHMFAIYFVNAFQKIQPVEYDLFLKFFLAIFVAYLLALLQKHLDNMRYKIRGFRVR